MYDFHKQNRKTNFGQVFYHPQFQKDKQTLLSKICRKSTDCNRKRADGKKKRVEKDVRKAQQSHMDLVDAQRDD